MDFFCLAGFFSGLISSSARAKPPRNNWYVRPGYAWILRYIHAPLRLNIPMSLVPWSDLKEWLDLIDHSTFLELPSISLVDFAVSVIRPHVPLSSIGLRVYKTAGTSYYFPFIARIANVVLVLPRHFMAGEVASSCANLVYCANV